MAKKINGVMFPELIFGIAGPIGIDIDGIIEALDEALKAVAYASTQIRITDEIKALPTNVRRPAESNYYTDIKYKMQHASAICRKNDDAAVLMRVAMDAIQRERRRIVLEAERERNPTTARRRTTRPNGERVPERVAYIIRQIKRPDEVHLLRDVYGRQFILVSAYGSASDRKALIEEKLARTMAVETKPERISALAKELIRIDADEEEDIHGQHMSDAFHMADVFVDGISRSSMATMVGRFINAFFGLNEVAPTKHEYGMYAAKGASLRSSDLSRQVGAAVFAQSGELLTQGCNEVPRAFGGTYWDGEEPDFRDIKVGNDPNDLIKRDVIRDILERLSGAKMLAVKGTNSVDLVDRLTKPKGRKNKGHGAGCLHGALVTDLTEYGRVVHAEMSAVCDAARAGVSLKGGILFATTFPCHNCTKHIIAAGISRVIYMEPYPKSRAKELHKNEIEIEKPSTTKVSFMPFIGISPFRYRDIFQKKKRKSDGVAEKWYYGVPRPMLELLAPTYTQLEDLSLAGMIGVVRQPTSSRVRTS